MLLIVPDGTRTAPVGLMFKTLLQQIGEATKAFDVLIALGTHQPMSEAAICRAAGNLRRRNGATVYASVQFFNHEWDNPAALKQIGTLPADEISELTDGLFAMDVPVEINRLRVRLRPDHHRRPGVSARSRRVSPAATNICSPAWAGRRS